jgi:hypothetical protein
VKCKWRSKYKKGTRAHAVALHADAFKSEFKIEMGHHDHIDPFMSGPLGWVFFVTSGPSPPSARRHTKQAHRKHSLNPVAPKKVPSRLLPFSSSRPPPPSPTPVSASRIKTLASSTKPPNPPTISARAIPFKPISIPPAQPYPSPSRRRRPPVNRSQWRRRRTGTSGGWWSA